MTKKLRKIYMALHNALITLPKLNNQSSISIQYVELVLKDIFKNNKSFSLSDYLIRKAYTRKNYEKKEYINELSRFKQ